MHLVNDCCNECLHYLCRRMFACFKWSQSKVQLWSFVWFCAGSQRLCLHGPCLSGWAPAVQWVLLKIDAQTRVSGSWMTLQNPLRNFFFLGRKTIWNPEDGKLNAFIFLVITLFPKLKQTSHIIRSVILDFKAIKRCLISDSELLEKLCLSLYDVLRPLIIHIIHLETLSELCSILKNEMLEDHVHNNGKTGAVSPSALSLITNG